MMRQYFLVCDVKLNTKGWKDIARGEAPGKWNNRTSPEWATEKDAWEREKDKPIVFSVYVSNPGLFGYKRQAGSLRYGLAP